MDLGVSQWLWRPLKDSEACVGQTESPWAQIPDRVVSYGAVTMPKPLPSSNQTLPLTVWELPAVSQMSAPCTPALPTPKSPPSLRICAGGFPLPELRPAKRQIGKYPTGGAYYPSRGWEKGTATRLRLCPAALEGAWSVCAEHSSGWTAPVGGKSQQAEMALPGRGGGEEP